MTLGSIVLGASVWVTLGVLIGWRLSQWQLDVRARRQVAAQLSLSRHLLELRAARQKNNYSALSKQRNPSSGFQRRAA
jgi:hypothetical protein